MNFMRRELLLILTLSLVPGAVVAETSERQAANAGLSTSTAAVSQPKAGASVPYEAPSTLSARRNASPAKTSDSRLLFQYGFEERIRTEDWNNAGDYNNGIDDERHHLRYRTRSWLSLGNDDVEVYARLVNEFKKQTLPDARLNMDEVFFDNLYVDIKKTPIRGLSVRVGRQDLNRGEGFILFDGSAGDGSRSAYFNAVDFRYAHKKSTLELIGILDPRQDRFLPRIHNQSKYLNERDEQAVGLYYTDRNQKNTDVDVYYFHKKEVHDYRAATNAQFQPDRHIETLGARVVHRLTPGVSASGEFVSQWGAQHANPLTGAPAADVRAWSGYGYVKKTFAHRMKPYVLGGFWALSGDDPSTTNRIEGFDPIFSRWPKWSEVYVYSQVPEQGVAYWTNNRMFQAETGFTPWKPVTFRATFYEEAAFHTFAKGKPTVFSNGTHRGDNLQFRMDYTLTPSLKGHVLYESFLPGTFYAAQANAYFFRAEIMYTFKGSLGLMGRH
jgi:hypothetical protein